MVANAGLPQPLRVFRARGAAFVAAGPEVAFPPDGAEVEVMAEGMLLRVRGGVGPFTWLVDGRPVVVAARAREAMVATPGLGFVVVSVIDGAGQSARVRVRLR
jgi:penicillin-binding protein 1C